MLLKFLTQISLHIHRICSITYKYQFKSAVYSYFVFIFDPYL